MLLRSPAIDAPIQLHSQASRLASPPDPVGGPLRVGITPMLKNWTYQPAADHKDKERLRDALSDR